MCLFVKRKKNEAEATSKLIAVIQALENRTNKSYYYKRFQNVLLRGNKKSCFVFLVFYFGKKEQLLERKSLLR